MLRNIATIQSMVDQLHEMKETITTKWQRYSPINREIAIQALLIPYNVTDTYLYLNTVLNFLATQTEDPQHPDGEAYNALYWLAVGISPLLFLSLAGAFGGTAARMFGVPENSFTEIKDYWRKRIGIVGAGAKVIAGELALYSMMLPFIGMGPAIAVAAVCGTFAFPTISSYLWSIQSKSVRETVTESSPTHWWQYPLNYLGSVFKTPVVAYTSAACYSLDQGAAYLESAAKNPQAWGLIDHSLLEPANKAEVVGMIITALGSTCEVAAIYYAFLRTYLNMLGLIKAGESEDSFYLAIDRSTLKKVIASVAVCYKVLTTTSGFLPILEKSGMPLAVACIILAVAGTGGMVAQSSSLLVDPLHDSAKGKPLLDANAKSSESEIFELESKSDEQYIKQSGESMVQMARDKRLIFAGIPAAKADTPLIAAVKARTYT